MREVDDTSVRVLRRRERLVLAWLLGAGLVVVLLGGHLSFFLLLTLRIG